MSGHTGYKTKISQLLNAFHTSGSELADILHIDSSLVSKWKTGKRSLKSNSVMLSQIIEHFCAIDAPSDYSTIRKLLHTEDENLHLDSPTVVKAMLKQWLLESAAVSEEALSLHNLMNASKKGTAYTHLQFKGNSGKRSAVLGMLSMAVDLPPGQELWCVMHDTQKWLMEDDEYLDNWERANLKFLKKGNTIHIIHTLDRQYQALAKSMLNWLPLYLTGNVTPYFSSPRAVESELHESIILLKDKLLLYQLSTDDESYETTTLAFSNETILQEANTLIKTAFDYATPLFTTYYLNDHQQYAMMLSQMVNLDEQQYVFMRFPFVNVLSTEQIREILDENDLLDDVKENVIKACRMLKKDARKNSGNHFRYLIPIAQLERLLLEERIVLDTLSFFSGKPLYINNATFRDLLRKLSALLNNKQQDILHEVALVEDTHVKQLRDLNMFVKKNTCISIFNSPEHFENPNDPMLLVTTESSIILSLFMYCDSVWRHTLPQKRERYQVARQLTIMTETIFPQNSET